VTYLPVMPFFIETASRVGIGINCILDKKISQ